MKSLIIPRDSIFRPVVNLYTATFNTPTVGQYNWAVSANVKQSILDINFQNLFYISTMNFSATVPENSFLENISTIPKIQLSMDQNSESLYGGAYPVAKYLVNNEISAFFWSRQDKDRLTGTFTGILNQNASLIPFATVTAVVAMNTYEITDRKFIEEFFHIQKVGEQIADVHIPNELDRRI